MKIKILFRLFALVAMTAVLLALPGVVGAQGQLPALSSSRGDSHACWSTGVPGTVYGTQQPSIFEDGMIWASDPDLILGRFQPGYRLEYRGDSEKHMRHHDNFDGTAITVRGVGTAYNGDQAYFASLDDLADVWYYDGLPQLADAAFYAPWEMSWKYGNQLHENAPGADPDNYVYNKFSGVLYGAGGAPISPFGSEENYVREARSTSRLMAPNEGIEVAKVTWVSKSNEAGGVYGDPLVAAEVNLSNTADIMASSQVQQIGGNRVITETRQEPTANPRGFFSFDCSGAACTHSYTQEYEIVSIEARADSIDTNNAEFASTTFERNQRNITGRTPEGQLLHTYRDAQRPGLTDPAWLDPDNPLKGNFPDTDEDTMLVELTLNDEYRKDFVHDVGIEVQATRRSGRVDENVVLSRFFEGTQRLRVLKKYSIGTHHGGGYWPMPAYYTKRVPDPNNNNRVRLDDWGWGGPLSRQRCPGCS